LLGRRGRGASVWRDGENQFVKGVSGPPQMAGRLTERWACLVHEVFPGSPARFKAIDLPAGFASGPKVSKAVTCSEESALHGPLVVTMTRLLLCALPLGAQFLLSVAAADKLESDDLREGLWGNPERGRGRSGEGLAALSIGRARRMPSRRGR